MGQLDFQHNPISDGSVRNPYSWTTVGSLSISTACSAVGMLKDHVRRSNLPPLVQPAHGMLKLTVLCVDVMPQFKAVVESIFGTVQGTARAASVRDQSTVYRMAEKAPRQEPESMARGGDGTLPAAGTHLRCCWLPGGVQRHSINAGSCGEVQGASRARHDGLRGEEQVGRQQQRWVARSHLHRADWSGAHRVRDPDGAMVHAKQVARKQLDTHKAYAKYRRYIEMLTLAGLLSTVGWRCWCWCWCWRLNSSNLLCMPYGRFGYSEIGMSMSL